jgi:predicted PurR-regulated permease PerM
MHEPALSKTPIDTVAAPERQSKPVPRAWFPLRWVVGVLFVAAALTVWPLWAPITLAAWCTSIARPLHKRLARSVGGSGGAAGVVTVLLALTILVPLVLLGFTVAGTVADLVSQLQQSGGLREAFEVVTADTRRPHGDAIGWQEALALLQQHGMGAVTAAGTLFGVLSTATIGLVVFVASFYTFLVRGNAGYRWMLASSPLPPAYLDRFAAAFNETGRGLLLGFGLTSLLQGLIAGIAYAIIGVRQSILLGALTAVCALIPVVGTGLVWGPVSIVLLWKGQTAAGIASLVVGGVVASLDNLVRPALARQGHLQLPTYVVFVAMLGGIAAFGPGGLLLGPLIVRLLTEGLLIGRDAQSSRP